MRSLYSCVVALALTAPAYTQTTPPAAPSLIAGPAFKGLHLDWRPVAGAAWYQVEHRAHATSPFVQPGANHPATTSPNTITVGFRLPLHLFDWTYARYRVAACNSAGCTRSNEVSVSDLRRHAVGYFKASWSHEQLRFGSDTDISPDGVSFVVAAPGDFQSGATYRTGSAYVFRRHSVGLWEERTRLVPPMQPVDSGDNTVRVSMSADGNTVVMGIPTFTHSQGDTQTGEAYVFRFNGTSWIRTRLQSGNRGSFGRWVAMNDAGDTIATPYGEVGDAAHRVAIYKQINGAWQPVRGIADRAGHTEFCGEGVLSSDGAVVAETCSEQLPGTALSRTYVRTHSGPNWTVREDIELFLSEDPNAPLEHFGLAIDGTGNTVAAQINEFPPNPFFLDLPSEVQVFSRTGGAYSRVARFKPGAWRRSEDRALFGHNLAISADGGTIAIGDIADNGYGTGPRAAPLNPDTRGLGAVYIYRLKSRWILANMVKPSFQPPATEFFGRELSLNANGKTLLVGNPDESGGDSGIGNNWTACCSEASGAVFMY